MLSLIRIFSRRAARVRHHLVTATPAQLPLVAMPPAALATGCDVKSVRRAARVHDLTGDEPPKKKKRKKKKEKNNGNWSKRGTKASRR